MTKTETLKFIRDQQLIQDRWLDSLPREISEAFFDNPHVDSLHRVNERLMREVFGEAFEDAMYFLYEWRSGFSITEADGTHWKLETDEDYYKYFRKVCGE